MDNPRELYQEMILDHSRRPRNFGVLERAECTTEGYNPLCGDHFTIYLHLENGRIADIRFSGAGCAISTASASLMTEALKGKSVAEAEQLFSRFHEMVTGNDPGDPALGKLLAMGGVREFPVRVKCATLAWHTMLAALHGRDETVTTE